jgi:hypothetical protein
MPCAPVHASFLYPCDLTDVEWAQLSSLLPGPARRGRPRRWAPRLLVNAIFYVLRTGCAWRYLPREYPPLANGVCDVPPVATARGLAAGPRSLAT